MTIEQARVSLSENSELLEFLNGTFEQAQSAEKLAKTVNGLELKVQEVIDSRQAIKDKYNNAKALFGVEEFNSDIVDGIKKGNSDEKLLADFNELKVKYGNKSQELQDMESNHSKALNQRDLENLYLNSGIMDDLAKNLNESHKKQAKDFILKGATIDENGQVAYLAENGTSLFNSSQKPLTIADRKSEFLSDPVNVGYLNDTVRGGGGSQGGNGGDNNVGKIDGTKEERHAYIQNKINNKE